MFLRPVRRDCAFELRSVEVGADIGVGGRRPPLWLRRALATRSSLAKPSYSLSRRIVRHVKRVDSLRRHLHGSALTPSFGPTRLLMRCRK